MLPRIHNFNKNAKYFYIHVHEVKIGKITLLNRVHMQLPYQCHNIVLHSGSVLGYHKHDGNIGHLDIQVSMRICSHDASLYKSHVNTGLDCIHLSLLHKLYLKHIKQCANLVLILKSINMMTIDSNE